MKGDTEIERTFPNKAWSSEPLSFQRLFKSPSFGHTDWMSEPQREICARYQLYTFCQTKGQSVGRVCTMKNCTKFGLSLLSAPCITFQFFQIFKFSDYFDNIKTSCNFVNNCDRKTNFFTGRSKTGGNVGYAIFFDSPLLIPPLVKKCINVLNKSIINFQVEVGSLP